MSDSQILVVVTVTTRNFLHRVRALREKVAEYLPGVPFVAACVDPVEARFETDAEDFRVVDASTLGVPRYRQLSFALDATGLCCAVKPYVILHAFEQLAAGRVVYLDNDIQLYRHPGELLTLLETCSFVVTPHLVTPPPDGTLPEEATILGYGVYNAGILAAANGTEAREFLRWWATRTADPQLMQAHSGYDQVWLNFAPAFVPNCGVLRDLGYNVASWNLATRPLQQSENGLLAGNAPLTAFHFSAFDEAKPRQLYRPHVRCNYPTSPATENLTVSYAADLERCGAAACRTWGYGFARFRDGSVISRFQREYFATVAWSETTAQADPFDPRFETDSTRAWRSVYHYHGWLARVARRLRPVR